MLRLSALLLSIVFLSNANAQKGPEPIRLCVATLENNTQHIVTPAWQRDQLIRAFERINKSKDVKKGKAASIDPVPLQSTKGSDPDISTNNCRFVLYTSLTQVLPAGAPQVSLPPAGAVQTGARMGDARAYPPDYHSATAEYRIMRAGDPQTWASGMVTGQGPQQEENLVSQLMDQIADRVASELRKPHPPAPQ
jgi:hypothetical protein